MPSLQLFSPVASAVHRMHLDALATYASAAFPGVSIDGADDGVAHALGRVISKHGVIFVQATGVTNILLLSVAAVLGRPVVYYLHEPTSLRVKLTENPWLKSLVWHAV